MRILPSVGYVYLIFIVGVICLICEYEVLVVEQPAEGLVELVEPLLRWRQFGRLADGVLAAIRVTVDAWVHRVRLWRHVEPLSSGIAGCGTHLEMLGERLHEAALGLEPTVTVRIGTSRPPLRHGQRDPDLLASGPRRPRRAELHNTLIQLVKHARRERRVDVEVPDLARPVPAREPGEHHAMPRHAAARGDLVAARVDSLPPRDENAVVKRAASSVAGRAWR